MVEVIDTNEAPEGPPGAPDRPQRTKRFRELQVRVYDFYMGFAMPMQLVANSKLEKGDPTFAVATQNYMNLCPQVADQWVTLAEQNPRIEAFLTRMMDGSVMGTLVMTHVAMAVPFLPPDILGKAFSFVPGVGSDGSNGNGHPDATV